MQKAGAADGTGNIETVLARRQAGNRISDRRPRAVVTAAMARREPSAERIRKRWSFIGTPFLDDHRLKTPVDNITDFAGGEKRRATVNP
jgi:hypothetical protein